MVFRVARLLLLVSWPVWPFLLHAAETNVVQFKLSAPYSSDDEIGRRFGYRPPLPEYDVSHESFRLWIPQDYSTNKAWGLMVWLSPTDDADLTADWRDELARRRVIIVAPYNCGNERHPIDRLRLAFDATSNTCRRYRIDRKRIYVGGFSSGARLACMIGIACGDIFTGTLCVCGVNFYKNIPAGGSLYFPSSFTPSAEVLYFAKTHAKYVLVTGDGDPDRATIELVAGNGFVRDGFKGARLLEVPGLQHAMPGLGPLDQALDYLDETLASGTKSQVPGSTSQAPFVFR